MRKQKNLRKKGFKRIYRKTIIKSLKVLFAKGVKEHSERLHSVLSGRGSLQITGRHSYESAAGLIPFSQLEPEEKDKDQN